MMILCLATASLAPAQDRSEDLGARHGFGGWGGVAVSTPTWWGSTQGHAVLLVGLRYRHTLAQSANASVAYTVDLIPAAAVTNTPVRVRRVCCLGLPPEERRRLEAALEQIEPTTAYGFGLAPLGLQIGLFHANPVSLALGLGGGFLLFDHDVPRLDTRKMNFTATLDAGLRVHVLTGWELTLGYKFHHLSNAGTGTFNPGLDANMFYLAWMRR